MTMTDDMTNEKRAEGSARTLGQMLNVQLSNLTGICKGALEFFKEKGASFKDKYNPEALMDKIGKSAKKLGASAVYYVLLLYYALTDDKIPAKDRLLVIGALGYFISPIDFIPDFLMPGLVDDLSVLMYVLNRMGTHITEDVKKKAKERLRTWFGDVELHALKGLEEAEKLEALLDKSPVKAATQEEALLEVQDKTIAAAREAEAQEKTGMFLFISFDEMSRYVAKRYGKELAFEKKGPQEVRIQYRQKALLVKIPVHIDVTVKEVRRAQVTLQYDVLPGVNLLISKAVSFVLDRRAELKGAVRLDGNVVEVDLMKIDKTRQAMKRVALRSILIEDTGIRIDLSLL